MAMRRGQVAGEYLHKSNGLVISFELEDEKDKALKLNGRVLVSSIASRILSQ